MSADFSTPQTSTPVIIGNLNNVIMDNQNLYTGSASTNSFKVSADGVYQITMNVQLQISSDNPSSPVIGIWDNTSNVWVARVNDYFVAPSGQLQTYTLITSIPMQAADTYSFRVINTSNGSTTTVKQLSSGSTGSGPVTQMTLRRLK